MKRFRIYILFVLLMTLSAIVIGLISSENLEQNENDPQQSQFGESTAKVRKSSSQRLDKQAKSSSRRITVSPAEIALRKAMFSQETKDIEKRRLESDEEIKSLAKLSKEYLGLYSREHPEREKLYTSFVEGKDLIEKEEVKARKEQFHNAFDLSLLIQLEDIVETFQKSPLPKEELDEITSQYLMGIDQMLSKFKLERLSQIEGESADDLLKRYLTLLRYYNEELWTLYEEETKSFPDLVSNDMHYVARNLTVGGFYHNYIEKEKAHLKELGKEYLRDASEYYQLSNDERTE